MIVEPVDRTFVARVYGEAEADVESGGYLFEYRWIDEYDFSYMGPSLAPYAADLPGADARHRLDDGLYAPLEELIRTVNDTPRDRFATEVGRLLDLPQLARFLGIQNCMAELDGFAGYYGMNNFYAVPVPRRPARGGDPVGCRQRALQPRHAARLPLDTNVLARRMMEVPVLRQTYVAAVTECALLLRQPAANDATRVAGAGDRSAVRPRSRRRCRRIGSPSTTTARSLSR